MTLLLTPGAGAADGNRRDAPPDPIEARVKTRLSELSFGGFAHCLHDLLSALGYTDVRVLPGAARHGRNTHGGMDLLLVTRTGVTRTPIIAQIKQYRRPVSRRFVDELRGAMLRVGARHGLLISTSTFSRVARRAATQDCVAPIRLVDGDEVAELMRRHAIGIRIGPDRSPAVDDSYFEALHARYPGGRPRRAAGRAILESPGSTDSNTHNPDGLTELRPFTQGGDMRWHSHLLAGIDTVWLLELIPGLLTPMVLPIVVSMAAFGALLPDLDAAESKLKSLSIAGVQPFAPFAEAANRIWGHRGFLHSPAALVAVALAAAPIGLLLGWPAALGLWLGYASHLVLDACTRTGIPRGPGGRRICLLPRPWRISTGSAREGLLLPLLAATALLLVLRHLPFRG